MSAVLSDGHPLRMHLFLRPTFAWVFCCFVLGMLLTPQTALARTERKRASSVEEQAAEQQQRGKAALDAGDIAAAQVALTSAYRSVQGPLGLFLLGRLAVAEKRTLDAYDLMRRFLADPELDTADVTSAANAGSTPIPFAAEIKEAETVVSQAPPPFASLSIRGERGTLVFIDGRIVGSLPLPLPLALSASEHKVALSLGSQRIEDQVQIPAGRAGELRSDVNSRALVLSILPGVLILEDLREVPDGLRQRLLRGIERALLARRMSPLTRDFALSLAQAPQLADCLLQHTCQVELARKIEAEAVLIVRAHPNPSGLQLRVGFVDLDVGEEASADEQSCQSCSPEQLASSLVELVSRVYESGHGRAHATLAIQSNPSGSEVLLDSKPLGVTPLKKTVFSGRHQLSLRKDSYLPEQRDLILRDNEQRSVDVVLSQPEPAPAPLSAPPQLRRMPRPAWRIALGSVLIAGGVVTMGFGLGARVIDGQCVQPSSVTGAECRDTFNTQGLSAVLLAGGLGLTAGGIVLVALPGPKRLVSTERDAETGPNTKSK